MSDRRLYRKRRQFDRKPHIGNTAFVLVAISVVVFAVLAPRAHKMNQLTESCGVTIFRARAPLPTCAATELPKTDDNTKVGEPDQSRVLGKQDYEVQHLAEKHRFSVEQVKN
jgi:hypothetical protein